MTIGGRYCDRIVIEYNGLSFVICRFSHGNINSELCCIPLYMIRKKYGMYVQEKQTIKISYHYTIIDLIIILLQ